MIPQAGHWADAYVGRPAMGRRPCWRLVRQVWANHLGFVMPSFDEQDSDEQAVALGAATFRAVPVGEEREFDAVMMMVPMRDRTVGPRGCRSVETHIGVVAARGLVLHVEQGRTARVDALKGLQVSRLLRGPWEMGGAT